tara:strand:- start:8351 stop:9502 length:1152 start_codon:yes stop_codon:yes gene_type:complete
MATAKQIKSAIRSQSSAQRGVTQQLAGVESLLQQADFSSKMSDIKNKQRETMFATAASGLELASTFGEGLKQKAELESNIKAFEESLPEAVRKAGGVSVMKNPNKASFMDVLKGEGSLSSFLYDEKEQYMLGENVLGSKYDVAAMGEKAKALEQTDLLDRFMQGEPLDSKSPTLELEASPTLSKSFKSIYGKETDIESLQDSVDKPLIKEDTTTKTSDSEIIVDSETGSPLEPNYTIGPLAPELIENNNLSSFLLGGEIGDYSMSQPIQEPVESISERYAKADFKNTKETRKISADVLSDKIKDLKIARENLKGLPKYDKRNKRKFSSLVSKREEQLKDLLSKVYNPELDVFFGDDFKGVNLRSRLKLEDKDSINFIKDFVKR